MLKYLKKINIKLAVVIVLVAAVGIAFLVVGIDPAILNMVMGAAILVAILFVLKIVISFISLPFGFLLKPGDYLVVKKCDVNVNPTDQSK